MKLFTENYKLRIWVIFGPILLVVAICFFRMPYLKLHPLGCMQWIQPFVTLAALLTAVLLVWVQLALQYWARGNARDRRDSIFQVSLMTSWIYLAILFFLIALVLAITSCSANECNICSLAVSFAATSLFMTLVMVLWQLLSNLGWIIYALCVHMPLAFAKPVINSERTRDKCYLFLDFTLAVSGLFLLSLNITGISSDLGWWIGKSFVAIAFLCLMYQYCQNLFARSEQNSLRNFSEK